MFGLIRKNTISPLIEEALGSTLSEKDLLLINGAGSEITLEAGATLIVEGTVGAEALLILDGTAAVSRGDDFVAHVGPGTMVGERSLITGEPRNATVIATTDVVGLRLNKQEFAWLCLFSTNFGEMAQKLAASR